MNEELEKLIAEAKKQGANDEQLRQIADSYIAKNQDKFKPAKKKRKTTSTGGVITLDTSTEEAQDDTSLATPAPQIEQSSATSDSQDDDTIDTSGYKEITDYIENTKVSKERVAEIRKEIDKDYETSQGFIGQAEKVLGKVTGFLSGSVLFSDTGKTASGDLSDEIKQAKKLLKEQGVKENSADYNDKLIQKAKDIKATELILDEKESMVRDYLSELPENKKEKAFGYAKNKMIALSSTLKNNIASGNAYNESLKESSKKLADLKKEGNLLSERAEYISSLEYNDVSDEERKTLKTQYQNIQTRLKEIESEYKPLAENHNQDVKELEYLRQQGLEDADDLASFEEHVDYLKRTYGFFDNIDTNWSNTWFSLSSSFQNFASYAHELGFDVADQLPDSKATAAAKAYFKTVEGKFKDEAEALDKVVLRSSELIEKPYSIKDVNSVSDLVNLTGNIAVQQTPQLVMGMSGYSAPFLFAISAAGNKVKEIESRNDLDLSAFEKLTSVAWSGVVEGTASSYGTIANVRKMKKAFGAIGKNGRKTSLSVAASDVFKGVRNEVGEELLVEFSDAGNRYVMFGDKDSFDDFIDSAPDTSYASAIFGGGTRITPHVVGMAQNIFSTAAQKAKSVKYRSQIKGLVNMINTDGISDSDRDMFVEKLAKTINESSDFIQDNLETISSLSKREKKEVGDLYFKIKTLRQKSQKASANKNIDAETKKKLVDTYKAEAKQLIQKKDELLENAKKVRQDESVSIDKEIKSVNEKRDAEIKTIEDAIIESNETGATPMVNGKEVSQKDIDEINEKYDEEIELIKDPKKKAKKESDELSRKRREVVNALKTKKESDDEVEVEKANALIKKTPKKLLESAENQFLRETIEQEVGNALAEGKTEEEIIASYEGRDARIAKDFIERGKDLTPEQSRKKVSDMFDKAEKERKNLFRSKLNLKDIWKKFQETVFDRRFFAKKTFNKADLKVNNTRVSQYMVAAGGASGRAKVMFDNLYNKVYKGLSVKENKLLDKLLLMRRIAAVDTQRAEQGKSDVINPNNLTKQDALAEIEGMKKDLGLKKFNRLNDRADDFFESYRDMLKEMRDEGFIDDATYNSFKGYDYVQRKFLQFLVDSEGDFDVSRESNEGRLSESPIKTLSQGSDESLVTDSMRLISSYISARSKMVLSNRANKAVARAVLDLQKKLSSINGELSNQDTTSKRKKELSTQKEAIKKALEFVNFDKTLPKGFRKVFYYEGGQRKSFNMEAEFYDSYSGQLDGVLKDPNAREAISLITGKSILQFFATGGNPTFFLTNTPRDFVFTSIFSSQYSDIILKNWYQLGSDLAKGINAIRLGIDNSYLYEKAVDYGIMMNFLGRQGRIKDGTFVSEIAEKVANKGVEMLSFGLADSKKLKDATTKGALSRIFLKLQDYGEVGFRVAIFNRTLLNKIKNLRKQNPEKYGDIKKIKDLEKLPQDLKESIFVQAAAESRRMVDFNQSGTIVKDLDSAIAYLNPATQSIRVAGEEISKRPLTTTLRIVQTVGAMSAIPIGLSVFFLGKLDDDELPEEYRGLTGVERYLLANQKTSKYTRVNYMRFYHNITKEGEFEYWRVAKTHDITPFFSLTENIINKKLAEAYDIDIQDNMREDLSFSFFNNIMPIDVDKGFAGSIESNLTRIPLFRSSLTYSQGYDFYRDRPLSYMRGRVAPEAEGFESEYVDDFYKEAGQEFGISPARLKGGIEAVITNDNTNPFISMVYGGADALTSPKEDKKMRKDMLTRLNQIFAGRLTGKTSRYADEIKLNKEQQDQLIKIEQDKAIRAFNFGRIIDRFALNEANPQEVIDEIKLQAETSPDETKKLINKLVRDLEKKSMPYKYLKLKYANEHERAMLLYNMFDDQLLNDSHKLELKKLNKVGLLNSKTINAYKEYLDVIKTGDTNRLTEYSDKYLNRE